MCPDLLNKINRKSRKTGYTLLEIVISILFFAIITIGLSLPMSNSINLTVDNKKLNTANNLARSYLKNQEAEWSIQNDFDTGQLIDADATYTNNGKYTVTVSYENISADSNGIIVIRRVHIKYLDSKGHTLSDIFYDYNRPGNV